MVKVNEKGGIGVQCYESVEKRKEKNLKGSLLLSANLSISNSNNNNNNNNRGQVSKLLLTHLTSYIEDDNFVDKLTDYLSNLEELLKLYKEIKTIIEEKNKYKATTLLFLMRNKVIYYRLLNRYYETYNRGSINFIFKDFINKGILTKIGKTEDINNGTVPHYKENARRIINFLKRTKTNNHNINQIIWYGLTGEAQEILPIFLKALLPIIPDDIRQKITNPSLKQTFTHTHAKLKDVELTKLKAYNRKYQELLDKISLIQYKTEKKSCDVDKQILKQSKAVGGDKMQIAQKMLKELKN